MSRFFIVIAVVLVVLGGVALLAPSLPAGNPIREIGESLRDFGGNIGRGFGGGYGELPNS